MGIAREGVPFILVPLILAGPFGWFGLWYAVGVLLFLSAFMAYFFRDPEREIPAEPGIIVSPADGRVTLVERLDPDSEQSPTVVSIFLSPLDVHVNRSPIACTVSDVVYTRGKFLMATDSRASLLNEQNALTLKADGLTVVCKQIAGILARRIVCRSVPGDQLAIGQRFGLIKFSSRTDVIVPSNVQILVQRGDKVKGGSSIIGRIAS